MLAFDALFHRGRSYSANLTRILVISGGTVAAPFPGRWIATQRAKAARNQVEAGQQYQQDHQRRQESQCRCFDDNGTTKQVERGEYFV